MIVVPEEDRRQLGVPLRSVPCQEDSGPRGWCIDTGTSRAARLGPPSSG